MGELDNLSVQIGRLQAGQENAERDRNEIRGLLSDLNKNMTGLTVALASTTNALADLKPQVEEGTKQRWVRHGIVIGTALGGGALGGKAAALLGWLGVK